MKKMLAAYRPAECVGFVLSLLAAAFIVFITVGEPAHGQDYRVLYSDGGDGAGLGADRNSLAFDNSVSWSVTGSVGSQIKVIRLLCTVDCYVAIGLTGSGRSVATAATGIYMRLETPELFKVTSSDTIAVIGAAASGSLIFHEMTR